MIIGVLYSFSPIAGFFVNYSLPGILRFLVAIAPFLILQAIAHWFTLTHLYPQKQRSNILWAVLFMPLLLFIGIGYAVLTIDFIAFFKHN